MTRQIQLKGWRMKDGKLVKGERRLDVSTRLRQRGSKKIKVRRPGAI